MTLPFQVDPVTFVYVLETNDWDASCPVAAFSTEEAADAWADQNQNPHHAPHTYWLHRFPLDRPNLDDESWRVRPGGTLYLTETEPGKEDTAQSH